MQITFPQSPPLSNGQVTGQSQTQLPIRAQLRATAAAADEGHWLLLYGLVAMVSILMFTGVAFWRISAAQTQLLGLGRATQSITASDAAASDLNLMDTYSANNALAGPGGSQDARTALDKARTQVDIDIRRMTQGTSLSTAEETQISSVQLALSEYNLRQGYENAQLGLGFPLGMDQQRAASDVIDNVALSGAFQMDSLNSESLARSEASLQSNLRLSLIGMMAVGTWILVLLGVGQFYLYRTFNRVFNPMVLVASVLVMGFTIGCLVATTNVGRAVTDVTQNAFNSIHALQLADADLQRGRRYESLYLLQPGQGFRYDHDYQLLSRRIFCAYPDATTAAAAANEIAAAKVPTAVCQPIDQALVDGMRQELTGGRDFREFTPGSLDGRYTGYLADELRNVTYGPAELGSALNAVLTFGVYQSIDAQMRTLETNSQHPDAIALNLGSDRGQVVWAFNSTEESIKAVIAVNQDHFNNSLGSANGLLGLMGIIAPIVGLLSVALMWLGLQPIISRYRVTVP